MPLDLRLLNLSLMSDIGVSFLEINFLKVKLKNAFFGSVIHLTLSLNTTLHNL